MARARARNEDGFTNEEGFTIVEVMVALSLLLIGVLGTVTMIDGANSVNTRTKAREGATALARTVIEISRGIPYRDLSSAQILAELQARPGLADAAPGTPGHQVRGGNFTYTVTPTACSMDDPKDGLGDHDEVGVTFCANSDALQVGQEAEDRNPDDYRSVAVRLDWSPDGVRSDTLTQTSVVSNPFGGLGPSVLSLTPSPPATAEITTAVTTAEYDVTTSGGASSVSWLINGARMGEATGAGTVWGFSWDLGPVETPKFVDCTYVLQAEAFDAKARAGSPKALTVTLNRRAPFTPDHFGGPPFEGGRNLRGATAHVDLQWSHSKECDVKEHRVYRGLSESAITDLVTACTRTAAQAKACVDEEAPADVTLYYQVVAVDTQTGGGDREGDRSPVLVVGSEQGIAPPSPPTDLSTCTGGVSGCNDIDDDPAPPDSAVLSWDPSPDPDIQFYRVYRDDDTYAHRLDVLYPVDNKPLVFVDATAAGPHTYYVSAVDESFGESALVGPVSWP